MLGTAPHPIVPMLELRHATARLRSLASATLLATTAALGGCAGTAQVAEPVTFGGDPAIVAAALEVMGPRSQALAEVQVLEALCLRQEIVSASGPKFVSEGPLSVRRSPATLLFRPGGSRARQVLETPKERLVVSVQRRHASRWRYESNGRALVGVASLMLDLDTLARFLEVRSVETSPEDPRLTIVAMEPSPGVEILGLRRLELTFADGKDVPARLRVLGSGEDVLEFEIIRVGKDPFHRNVDAHFRLEVPAGFTVAENG